MVLIFSKKTDFSTDQVIDWLVYYGVKYSRLNGESLFTQPKWEKINENTINSVWFRRTYTLVLPKIPTSPTAFLKREFAYLYAYNYYKSIKYYTESDTIKYTLNKHEDVKLHKLKVLDLADKHGLNVPISEVLCKKTDLQNFLKKVKHAITKPISEIFYHEDFSSNIFIPYTKEITRKEIELLPDIFFPSFFQQKINKEFEIRIVFLEDSFFSMAIFSSSNTNTQEDFRNYDFKKMNRFVPFKLPNDVESSLKALCQEVDLNFCSIDMIFDGENYYFLEINPVGQFGMTSLPCNYNIEKKIAKLLSQKQGASQNVV